MMYFIAGLIFAPAAILLIIGYVKSRLFRSVDGAIALVRKDLQGKVTPIGTVQVPSPTYPLSDEMVKEIAQLDGFTYHGEGSKSGFKKTRVLNFDPPTTT